LTAAGWILFRSHSLAQIRDILKTLVLDFGHLKLNAELPTSAALVGLPLFILMEYLGYRSHGQRLTKVMPVQAWTAVYSAMIFLIILGLANVPTGFIYFVF
jgi:hypothetical protein